MASILEGFALISVAIATGWVLAHLKVLTMADRAVLARLTFPVGAPVLVFLLIPRADLQVILSTQLLATFTGAVVTRDVPRQRRSRRQPRPHHQASLDPRPPTGSNPSATTSKP